MTPDQVIHQRSQDDQHRQGKADAEEGNEGVKRMPKQYLPGDFYVVG